MKYILIIMIAYLIGCSNMAWYLAKLKKVELTDKGSGNLGASNAMILMGWPAGILVGAHDILKAFLAVFLAKTVFPEMEVAGVVAGVACILGHIFPFYLKFKGGKGFASYLGMTLALNWKFAFVVMVAVVVVTLITDYIVVGTVTTVISVPVYLGITVGPIVAVILCIATGVILYKHRHNFVRIWKGTEIGLRSANKGEHRV